MRKAISLAIAGSGLSLLVFYLFPAVSQEARFGALTNGRSGALDQRFFGGLPDGSGTGAPASDPAQTLVRDLPAGLPVGASSVHAAPNAWGTAIYLPQNHRYPGTAVGDAKNDSAELAQGQIYEIQKHLYSGYGIDLVMTEGELFGEIPQDKIDSLKAKIALRTELEAKTGALADELDNSPEDRPKAEALLKEAQAALAALDREIILAGASHKLKAEEGAKLAVYGAEDAGTREECAAIVRDYIYLQDRLDACQPPSAQIGRTGAPAMAALDRSALEGKLAQLKAEMLGPDSALKDLLGRLNGLYIAPERPDLGSRALGGLDLGRIIGLLKKDPLDRLLASLERLKAEAEIEGRSALAVKIASAQETGEKIARLDEGSAKSADTAAPSRQANPYQAISDPEKLEGMIADSEKKIEEKVVGQRNRETAVFFARALKENNETAGILQYGAGHEEGLIEELNKQGLTVVVLEPAEVTRRELAGEE